MIKYTKDNTEVQIVRELNDGYLVRRLLCEEDNMLSEDEEDVMLGAEILFYPFDQLFDKPVVDRLAKEAASLQEQKNKLYDEIRQLHDQRSNMLKAQDKIKDWPFIQNVVDYLSGNYKYILFMKDLQLRSKDSIFNTPYIYLLHTKVRGWCLFRLQNENFMSSDGDVEIRVFDNTTEAYAFCKQYILDRLNNWQPLAYNASQHLKGWFTNLHPSCGVKDVNEIVNLYEAKLAVLVEKERIQRKEQLEKDIKELEEKKRKLDDLNK